MLAGGEIGDDADNFEVFGEEDTTEGCEALDSNVIAVVGTEVFTDVRGDDVGDALAALAEGGNLVEGAPVLVLVPALDISRDFAMSAVGVGVVAFAGVA